MAVLQGLVALNGVLYAAWKSKPDDDRIFYSQWSGSGKWSAAGIVDGATSAGPSLGVFNNSLYAAWKGEWSDPRVFFAKYSGSQWEPQSQIPNIYSDTGPALCQFGSTLVAAWKYVFDQSLQYATYDGTKWSDPSQIPAVASSVGPSLANFGGKLYAAWKGEGSDQGLYYATYDGSSWSAQTQIINVASSVGPSLAVVGNTLYAVWKGESTDENLYYAYYPFVDGSKTTWSSQAPIPASGSSMGAAIAGFNGTLYAMCKGKDSDTTLYNASFNGKQWSGWTKDIPGNTGPDTFTTLLPTPPGGNANYLLADSKGAAITGTTVTMIVVEDIVPDNTDSYSIQINCNSPAQNSGAAPFVWQQYGFRMAINELFFWVNDFRQQDLPGSPLINWDSRSMPNNTGVVPLPNNRLPSGWQLTTTLTADSSGKVTGFAFSVAQPNGTVLNAPVQTLQSINSNVVAGNLATILNYQVILVGENGGGTTDFSAGKGIFLCHAKNSLVATVSQDESGEGSNVSYSPLPASYPNGEFFQEFGVGTV
jgi:hypothetical protein